MTPSPGWCPRRHRGLPARMCCYDPCCYHSATSWLDPSDRGMPAWSWLWGST